MVHEPNMKNVEKEKTSTTKRKSREFSQTTDISKKTAKGKSRKQNGSMLTVLTRDGFGPQNNSEILLDIFFTLRNTRQTSGYVRTSKLHDQTRGDRKGVEKPKPNKSLVMAA